MDFNQMQAISDKELRRELAPFAVSNNWKAAGLLAWSAGLFALSLGFALFVDNAVLRLLASLMAGVQIGSLSVIGHDCAHGSFFSGKRANMVFARLAMLPSLHNVTLWQLQHNKWHHAAPNVKGYNSWSPLSPRDYEEAGLLRRGLERFYRSLTGMGFYYLIERWLSFKLLPGPSTPRRFRRAAWADFALVAAFFLVWCGLSWLAAGAAGLFFGLLLPFAVWNFLMAITVYLQHTHPRIPWYGDREAYRAGAGQHELTLHVVTPRWYGWLSNEIMEHSAHHVHSKIPLYNLHRAQARLEELLGGELPQETASLRLLLDSLRRCQLYDFEAKAWCAFDGRVTARCFGAAGEGRQTARSLASTARLRSPGPRTPGVAAGPMLKSGPAAEKRRAS